MILKYSKIVAAHILLGVVFGFFYTKLAVPSFEEVSIKIRDTQGLVSFELPEAGTHMIKIWGTEALDHITLNGARLIHVLYRPRQVLKEFYYIVRPELTRKGTNELKIDPDNKCSVRIKNNIVTSAFGSILFRKTVTAPPTLAKYTYPVFIAGFVLLGLAIAALAERLFAMSFNKFFIRHLLSFAPCLLFLGALHRISFASPIRFVFIEGSFFIFCGFFTAVFYVPLFISVIARELKKTQTHDAPKLKERLLGLALVRWWLTLRQVDQLMLIFLTILIVCGILLTFKLDFLAGFLGDIAYLLICTATIIHLLEARKCKKGRESH